jgi:hypothetical protein
MCDEYLNECLVNHDINNAIEIGTANGLSTLYLAKYSKGLVFTFDVVKRNSEFIWSFFPGLRKKIYSVVGSQEYIDGSIKDIKHEGGVDIDFAFIDGEHDYFHVRHDFELCRIAGSKKFLFHDMNNPEVADYVVNVLGGNYANSLYGYLTI